MDNERSLNLIKAEWAFPFDQTTVRGTPKSSSTNQIAMSQETAKNLLTIP
jgi:hypothetical protein